MCRIIEKDVKCTFAVVNTEDNSPILGDLVVHSPGNYTWEFERGNHALLIREDGSEEFRGYLPSEGRFFFNDYMFETETPTCYNCGSEFIVDDRPRPRCPEYSPVDHTGTRLSLYCPECGGRCATADRV